MTTGRTTGRSRLMAGAGLLAAGAVAGAVVAGTMSANAATTPTPSPGSTAAPAGPGVQENDGIPEAQEHHGGPGGNDLGLTGTVTAVGSGSVTIRTSSGTTVTYAVAAASDIDKNGEAQLSSLAVGDAVRYSVTTGTTTIDRLHAGDEGRDRPAGAPSTTTRGYGA